MIQRLITALGSDNPKEEVIKLRMDSTLDALLPELIALDTTGGPEAGLEDRKPCYHKNNYNHSLDVLDNISKITDNEDVLLRLAALLHDIGKIPTRSWDEEREVWTFYNHEYVGAGMVEDILRLRFGFEEEKIIHITTLVKMHMRHINLNSDIASKTAIRRYIKDAGPFLDDLLKLMYCDLTTRDPNKRRVALEHRKNLVNYIRKVEEEDRIMETKLDINGNDIMRELVIGPCEFLGQVKDEMKELVLSGNLKNNYLELLDFVRSRFIMLSRENQLP